MNFLRTEESLSEYLPKVKQKYLLDNNITYDQFVILTEINSSTIVSVKYILDRYPALFNSKDTVRRILKDLFDRNLLVKDTDGDLFSVSTNSYKLSASGETLITRKEYTPKYTLEEYTKAVQIIDYWNSFKEVSTHTLKPYGEVQTKTIESCIKYISQLLTKTKYTWIDVEVKTNFSIEEVKYYIDDHILKFSDDYLPEDKSILSKSLSNFFLNYKTKYSDFFSVIDNEPVKNQTTIDKLKEFGVKAPTLKLAYEVLSATGSATESEKLDIQKQIVWNHQKYTTQKECVLDDLYIWKKQYRENFGEYNVFLYNLLQYIKSQFGIGKAKPQFLSFRKGSKIIEGFSKTYADKFNIFMFPTQKQKENIMKSRIV